MVSRARPLRGRHCWQSRALGLAKAWARLVPQSWALVNSTHRQKAGTSRDASYSRGPWQTLTLVTMSIQVQDVEVSLELRPHHDLLQRQRSGSG